jgi:hypothetical protein
VSGPCVARARYRDDESDQNAGRRAAPTKMRYWNQEMRPIEVRELRQYLVAALLVGQVAGACSSVRSEGPRQADPSPVAPDQRLVAEWQLFTSPGAFSLHMPGEPKASGKPPAVTYLVRIGRDVTYYVYTIPLRTLPTGSSIKEFLEALRDESLREVRARLLWSEAGRASLEPCVTFLAEAAPKGFPRTRLLTRIIVDVDDLRIVFITHSAPADGFQEPRAKEFIASFTLLHGGATRP